MTLLVSVADSHALTIPASSYDRHFFTEPGSHAAVQAAGKLSGGRWGISGWVEYSAQIAETGWYKLWTLGDAPAGVEFSIDPDGRNSTAPENYFYQRGYGGGSGTPVGNVWLTAGRHRLRLARFFWTGFPAISAIELRRSSGNLEDAVHVFFRSDQHAFRQGECPELVIYGGAATPSNLEILDSDRNTSRPYGRYTVSFAATDKPEFRTVRLNCGNAGFHRLSWRFNGQPASTTAQPPLEFQVIDSKAPPQVNSTPSDAPLVDIDCTTQPPDFASQDGTRIRHLGRVRYRESGDTGWIRYQRSIATERSGLPEPDWFAYTLRGVLPQQRYRVEVDYPDDAARTFAVAWRDSAPLQYPMSSAVETGREYRLSGAVQTLAFHVWARAAGPRLTFMTAHDGRRAACLRIRVFLDESFAAVTPTIPSSNRQFLHWYEEGENFVSLFGPATDDAPGFSVAAERWLRQAADIGVSTLMPTVSVYNFGMYPSRFNQSFSEPQRDTLRVLLLQAERFGIRLIPELHPRADELGYARGEQRHLSNLAVSREGKNNFTGPSGRNVPPYFNALDPVSQRWYIGMVRELAERYRDSPALQGISLRYMAWANPSLNNLVNLDWGYNDEIVALYRAETGSKLPDYRHDALRFQQRHAWLLANEKAAWIQWRCAKLTHLYTLIRNTVRAVRPNLQIYLHLFGPSTSTAEEFHSQLRAAGLDLDALAKIEGLTVVNSTFNYGRLEEDGILFNASRDPLLDPAAMGVSGDTAGKHWLVPTSLYLEAIGDIIVPPQMLGLPASTKAAWVSAASNPPGRQALERIALLLAQTDTLALGDGGNNHTLGPPIVAQFVREFRKLPAVPFVQEPDAVDPVTIRSHAAASRFTFYAVNRENYPVQVSVSLSNGEVQSFSLQGYELRVFSAEPGTRISRVSTAIPGIERARIAERIQWTRSLLTHYTDKSHSGDVEVLRSAVVDAQRALDRGFAWRAHSLFETSAALRAFSALGCLPPDMRIGFENASTCNLE